MVQGQPKTPERQFSEGTDPFQQRSGHTLSWEDVTVTRGLKTIVNNLVGEIRPYHLTAIMGHSGAGKTTLLNVLSGKTCYDGKVQLDGVEIVPNDIQRKIAFVAQEDTLLLTATPYEAIAFSARLRLPTRISDREADQLAKRIVQELGLDSCRDTLIKDLSGGQRRRVSLGIELVVRPSVVLIDEPTSGLDSHTALQVVEGIKKVSNSGASVLLTIHQPNHQMFQALDHIMLLHHGRTMFQGPANQVTDFFEKKGYPVPHGINPADWMLIISQENTEMDLEEHGFFAGEAIHSSADGSDAELGESSSNTQTSAVMEAVKDMSGSGHLANKVRMMDKRGQSRKLSIFETVRDDERLSIFREVSLLMQREVKTMYRSFDSMVKRLGLAILGGALTAVTFQGVADGKVESSIDFQSHVGALFFMIFTNVIATELILFEFVLGRPLFEREFATNHFRMISYGFSKSIIESASIVLPTMVGNLVAFWAVGFQGRFWYLVSVFAAYGLVSAALGVMVGSIPKDATKSVEYVTLAIIPQLMLSGFYVATTQLPKWLRWAQYLMPLTYAYRLSLQEEFAFCSTPNLHDQYIVDCVQAMFNSGFALGNEGNFFNDNSTYILPQTGIYKGQQAIEEYTALFPPDDDPNALFQEACFIEDTIQLVVNEATENQCNFFFGTIQRAKPNPEISALPGDVTVENAFGLRLEFSHEDTRDFVIDNMFLEYIDPTQVPLPIGQGVDFDKTAKEVCETLENTCGTEFYEFDNQTECFSAMRALPDFELTNSTVMNLAAPEFRLTSNTTGCRAIHLYLARNNPEGHCAHISYPSQADPDGHLICDPVNLNVEYEPLNEMEQSVLNMVSGGYGLDATEKSRVVAESDAGQCISNPAVDIQQAFVMADPFEAIDFTCFTFLQINDATKEFTGLYWSVLFGMVLFFRGLSLIFLRRKVVRNH